MTRPFLVFTFLLVSVSCSQKRIKISNPNEFLSKSGFWCFDGDIHNCIRYTKDSIIYVKNLEIYNKIPYQILSFDSLRNEISYTPFNDFEIKRIKELFEDIKNEKKDISIMNGVPLSNTIYVISHDQIGISESKLENGILTKGEIFGFSRLESLTKKQKAK